MEIRRLKPKSKWWFTLYAGLLLIALRVCTSERPTANTSDVPSGGDTIDVAIEYSPLSLYRYNDTLGGFNYDALRLMAAAEGLHVKFHPITSIDAALDRLDSGRFDLIVADVPVTSDYKSKYAFSEPLYLDRQVLVQRMDSNGAVTVPDQLSLAGLHVWVPKSSPAIVRLRNLGAEIGDTIYLNDSTGYGSEQLFILTSLGDVDYAVVNEKVAKRLASHYKNVDISTEVSFTQFQSWLMRPADSVLTSLMDSAIVRFKHTAAYDSLCIRYGIGK
ncbi:MAG: transporter substrate-binding domain-containing protein [Muribaculaceae bacterium]|nr:transporter substrate-binding domain-containing protein [Muribaculaceae bacterium]